MAVSPADFELYSRVTGRAVPRSPQERMKMAPAVNKFIKNREYERPQRTTLQKGADLLGKAALIGGALAAGHAIGGGFRGKTAENVGKVADVVQNLAKTGVVGAEGGDSGLDFGVSGGSPVPYGQPPTSGGNIDLGGVDNTVLPAQPEGSAQIVSARDKTDDFLSKLLPAPVRPDVIAEQEVNAFGVPTPKGGRDKVWGLLNEAEKQKQAENIYGELLTKEQRMPLHRQYSTIQSDQKQPDYPAEGSTQEAVDNFLRDRYYQATEESLRAIPGISASTDVDMKEGVPGWRVPPGKPIYEKTKQLQAPFPPVQPLPLNDRGIEGGGGALVPSSPQPTEIVATTPESSEVVSNEGGLRQRVEDFGNRAEQHVKDWWHLDNEKIGYQIQGALENENPLAGAAQVTGVIGPALAKQGLLNAGQTAQGLYGYGKEFMGDYIDTVKQGYKRAQDIALSDQIRSSSMGVGGGKVLGGDFSVSGSPLLYGMQNQLDQGWSRHDAAIGSLQKNIQAVLPTTVPTGQVAIGENAQLNRHPDLPPGETDMAPSRLIQQFSDRRISGEGSLTPGDRSDLSALLSGSRGQYGPIEGLKALGPDETVSGDIEIRTDVGVNDPVNFTSGFYDKTRRPSKGEKAKFISGLKERNKDIYSNASDLPARKVGGKGKMGTSGLAGSMAGVSDWESRDAKDPLHGVKQFAAGLMEEPDLSDKVAEDVGKRMAEREQQQGSTEWVRSPDGKLRRVQIDDPW